MFRETHEAIEKVQPGTPNLDATHPLQLAVEDLTKASPLSGRTRRWLRNSRITVAPDRTWYLATIRLESGSDCTLSFEPTRGLGILGGVCE